MAKTYDTKCYDLAEHFMQDEAVANDTSSDEYKKACRELALAIQETVEDWFLSHGGPLR